MMTSAPTSTGPIRAVLHSLAMSSDLSSSSWHGSLGNSILIGTDIDVVPSLAPVIISRPTLGLVTIVAVASNDPLDTHSGVRIVRGAGDGKPVQW